MPFTHNGLACRSCMLVPRADPACWSRTPIPHTGLARRFRLSAPHADPAHWSCTPITHVDPKFVRLLVPHARLACWSRMLTPGSSRMPVSHLIPHTAYACWSRMQVMYDCPTRRSRMLILHAGLACRPQTRSGYRFCILIPHADSACWYCTPVPHNGLIFRSGGSMAAAFK